MGKTNKPACCVLKTKNMTIWFCVKTTQSPDEVARVVCAFNTFDDEPQNGKCNWFIEKGEGAEEYWKILAKYEKQKDVTCIALIYREGDTVVLGEVADEVLPNFMAPLLAKFGFDCVKWIVAHPKR
jgi:hypothetical protein